MKEYGYRPLTAAYYELPGNEHEAWIAPHSKRGMPVSYYERRGTLEN